MKPVHPMVAHFPIAGWLGGELVFSDGVSVRRSRETGSGDSKQASHHH